MPFRGLFRVTGKFRTPKPGENYWSGINMGVDRCGHYYDRHDSMPRVILEKVL